MTSSFHPPGIESLADIDVADASYGNKSVIIQGVVSPKSQGGWAGQNDHYKIHFFAFAAWRRLGGTPVERDLTILRPVPPNADYWDDFPKHSIQRIRVLLSSDETRAILEQSLPVDTPDDELRSIANELQKPVVVSTERFGNLVLDRSIDWFEAKTKWNGAQTNVTFPVDGDKPDINALTTAELLWSDQAKWKERIEAYAVKELFDIWNGNWREDDEPKLTSKQFLGRMTLTSISISSEGTFEFWYDDGNLFAGHSIMVSGNLKDGPTGAGIHG